MWVTWFCESIDSVDPPGVSPLIVRISQVWVPDCEDPLGVGHLIPCVPLILWTAQVRVPLILRTSQVWVTQVLWITRVCVPQL